MDLSIKRTILAVIIIVSTFFCMGYLNRGENIKPNKPFAIFPKKIGKWDGKVERFDKKIYDELGVDDSILVNYVNEDRQVQLYVGFYQSQKEGDLIHSPKNCMPGAGWNIRQTSVEEVTTPLKNPQSIRAIKLILEKEGRRQVVLYWFQSRGRFIASEYLQKIYLVLDSISRRRTDGSFVRLITPIINGDEKKAMKDLKDFASLLIPILKEYVPS